MPESVNLIFGRNLRKLCEARGTFTEAATLIGVSRMQLTRFFRGESFPKPTQLARICSIFGVDARIYTQALEDIMVPPKPVVQDTENPCDLPGMRRYLEQPIALPSGIHVLYRPAFTLENTFIMSPLLVQRTKRFIRVKGIDAHPLSGHRPRSGARRRRYEGFALASPDGVVMLFHGTGDLPFLAAAHFLSNSYFAATGTYRGSYELFRPHAEGEKRRVPIVLDVLQQHRSKMMPLLRKSGFVDFEQIPAAFRPYLSRSI